MTILRSRRLRRAALLFAGIFVFAVVTQLGVGWYRRREAARADLREAVGDVRKELRYESRWELTRLRQADLGGRYYIVDASGLIIDVEGFPADLTFRADLTDLQLGIHSLTVPLTNETWRLLVAPVKGGRVTLGVTPPEDITGVDDRLQQNAKRFGESLERATRVAPSDIDRNIDYAVLDDRGRVRFAIGGIPLSLVEYPKSPMDEVEEVAGRSTLTYALLSVPFVSASGQTVGTVTALEELAPQPWFSFSAWLVNVCSSLVLAFLGKKGVLYRFSRNHVAPVRNGISSVISSEVWGKKNMPRTRNTGCLSMPSEVGWLNTASSRRARTSLGSCHRFAEIGK